RPSSVIIQRQLVRFCHLINANKVFGTHSRYPGELNVATRCLNLRNLLRARRRRLRYWREIAILYEDRDMREGGDLSRSKIRETTCLQLNDAFYLAGCRRCPGVAARIFGVTHQHSAAQFFREFRHLSGSIPEDAGVSWTAS